ncbi:DUF3592 domain-containing protein [Streptomyces sp. RY43-2]|uniref:DUF3592 domain-containing protein n=1 Tax=Streptomyces macrolidinus TaxID=2952607 RepID=A0ABT0ZLJ0_9ACTN|nr:DUF3592 domain-containing protein [Streptomyces macrolidinus]MCN9244469.1 DUF3592 domain-containing protein [Streptomyces macrolidinus]
MSTFEMTFLAVGLASTVGIVLVLYRMVIVIRLVLRGERTRGWCVTRRMSPGGNSQSHPQFVFAFRTPDGETVEFKDRPGAFGYEVGAPVRVCYDPARPRKRATIAGPDTWGPVYVRLLMCIPLAGFSFVTLYSLALNWGLVASY